MLASLRWPPLPSAFAPSNRPDEPITSGVDIDLSQPQTLEDLISITVDLLHRQQDGTHLGPSNEPSSDEAAGQS